METETRQATKRKGGWPKGRPRKKGYTPHAAGDANVGKATGRQAPKWREKFGQAPDWGERDFADVNEDRLYIAPEVVANLARQGIALEWKVQSVFGQEQKQMKSVAARNGWKYVSAEEANEMGIDCPTETDGLALMARPMVLHKKAKALEEREARAPLDVQQRRHQLGEIPGVSLDPSHSSARQFNHHRRSVERLDIPTDD